MIWYYCFDSFLPIEVLWDLRTSLDLDRSCAEKLHSSVLSSCSFRAMTLVLQSLARSFVKRSSTSLMVGKSLPTPRKWPMQEKVYSSPVSSRVIVLHHLILVSVVWISGLQIVYLRFYWYCCVIAWWPGPGPGHLTISAYFIVTNSLRFLCLYPFSWPINFFFVASFGN